MPHTLHMRKELSELQKDLLYICIKDHIRDWNVMRDYAAKYRKYDRMTFRQLDEVFGRLPLKITA
jgi:hypothetical protein